jgi:metal-sulfur cluster biosynthetic enzyme
MFTRASNPNTGLANLGLVESVTIEGGTVAVVLITTSPQCMYVGHFVEEPERRLRALPWVATVQLTLRYDIVWDEGRMTSAARAALAVGRRPAMA